MRLVKLTYATGTHYCDADRIQPGQKEPLKLLIVTPVGNIHYQLGFSESNLPKDILEEANKEASENRRRFNEEWEYKSIYQKYEIMNDFFQEKPITFCRAIWENKAHCDRGNFKFSYENWINKFREQYFGCA